MGLAAILKDPETADEGLSVLPPRDEDIAGGLAFLSYADGLITAVVVGPEPIPVSEWMALLVNNTDGAWGDGNAELAMAAMSFAHSKIIKSLRSRAKDYEPFFWEDREDRLITRDWAEGFLAGVRLREDAWEPLRKAEAKMLTGLLSALLQDEKIDARLTEMGVDPEELFSMALDTLPDLVQVLYGIRKEQPLDRAMFRAIGKAGRNDPCPCGSGKKYKKCCLN